MEYINRQTDDKAENYELINPTYSFLSFSSFGNIKTFFSFFKNALEEISENDINAWLANVSICYSFAYKNIMDMDISKHYHESSFAFLHWIKIVSYIKCGSFASKV
jgi:hypothetical protein